MSLEMFANETQPTVCTANRPYGSRLHYIIFSFMQGVQNAFSYSTRCKVSAVEEKRRQQQQQQQQQQQW